VVIIHEHKGSGSPKRVPCRRLLGRCGILEVIDISMRAEFNDAESDGVIPLKEAIGIGAVEIT
jgi:hypothetical protein